MAQPLHIVILDDDKEKELQAFVSRLQSALPGWEVHTYRHVTNFLTAGGYEAKPDVVLLDVQGMDMPPEEAIPAIHQHWARLPVIILTRGSDFDLAIGYFHRGARGFLQRGDLDRSLVVGAFEDSTDVAQVAWRAAAEVITFVAKEYQPVKRILYDTREIGRVKKGSSQVTAPTVEAQISFLDNSIPRLEDPTLSALFPRIITSDLNALTYEIPYYRAVSLRRTLFSCRDSEEIVDTAKAVLTPLLPILKERLFERTAETLQRDDWGGYIERFYTGKLRTRLNTLREMLASPRIPDGQRYHLERLINADQLTIGDRQMRSPLVILEELLSNEDRLAELLPSQLGLIHGDLHFDNMLVDASIAEHPFIKLIDPRGFVDISGFRFGADFAYDIGKLLHSCHGKYDMIDDGYEAATVAYTKLDSAKEDGRLWVTLPSLSRIEWVSKNLKGGSGDIVTSESRLVTDTHFQGFDKINEWLVSKDGIIAEIMGNDKSWRERAQLNEALHFLTMGPFHLRANPIKVFALFVRGAELMSALGERWDVS